MASRSFRKQLASG
jgi:hypothetical protein